MLNIVVLISGGGSNLRALLERAARPDAGYRIVAVGADNQAAGLQHAADFGVPSFVVSPTDFADRQAWGRALAAKIVACGISKDAGLIVSAGFMRVLPADFVHEFTPRIINTHPALLPLFPGAHAVEDALAAGATKTGATVHFVDEGVDTGRTIAQCEVDILQGETVAVVHEKIKVVERQLLVDVVQDIATGKIALLAD
ncbi:phosphoribosylglycinamide formyltransferase [Canibacter sp. lx-72]|uniref:phosphoribosylglycinamide formyltransferase n=1 Tax=Canibacter zhuwentaonis TaxID=2837491 RepID=UPI001BDC1BC5|nr:phosphoribosylglycinamide formyltransferase [Canibacter zhuwentaonis]MBT1018453.1 phosphoribosylglycinamide formyltransferase [Canibacter zhuwentaonis]MBT1035642.1 phosphoribosylglycinamide formyltransferase [Canibacter zhuwentaonis]